MNIESQPISWAPDDASGIASATLAAMTTQHAIPVPTAGRRIVARHSSLAQISFVQDEKLSFGGMLGAPAPSKPQLAAASSSGPAALRQMNLLDGLAPRTRGGFAEQDSIPELVLRADRILAASAMTADAAHQPHTTPPRATSAQPDSSVSSVFGSLSFSSTSRNASMLLQAPKSTTKTVMLSVSQRSSPSPSTSPTRRVGQSPDPASPLRELFLSSTPDLSLRFSDAEMASSDEIGVAGVDRDLGKAGYVAAALAAAETQTTPPRTPPAPERHSVAIGTDDLGRVELAETVVQAVRSVYDAAVQTDDKAADMIAEVVPLRVAMVDAGTDPIVWEDDDGAGASPTARDDTRKALLEAANPVAALIASTEDDPIVRDLRQRIRLLEAELAEVDDEIREVTVNFTEI
nr:hypothetical protein HK105_005250 [Polyrhizophydium stewartii]